MEAISLSELARPFIGLKPVAGPQAFDPARPLPYRDDPALPGPEPRQRRANVRRGWRIANADARRDHTGLRSRPAPAQDGASSTQREPPLEAA